MSNEFMQRRFLLNKAGFSAPKTAGDPQPNQNQQQSQPALKPPTPKPNKPGCSACSRRKPQ